MTVIPGRRWLQALMLAAMVTPCGPAAAQDTPEAGPGAQQTGPQQAPQTGIRSLGKPPPRAAAEAETGGETGDAAEEVGTDRATDDPTAAPGAPTAAGTPTAAGSFDGRDPRRGPVTNLPLPRYVSLKGSEGNARRGPSLSHRIDWVFRHAGMPLRVTAEYGHWRRVEDRDGAGGWVHYSLLSGVRTALVAEDMAELRARPDADASVMARAEQGAIVKLGACADGWCQILGGGASGWVRQSQIWGVDPGEERD